jgi:hypothetical protein
VTVVDDTSDTPDSIFLIIGFHFMKTLMWLYTHVCQEPSQEEILDMKKKGFKVENIVDYTEGRRWVF